MGRKRTKEKAGHERDSIVLSDIYLHYPHKYYVYRSKTIPFPYFPKDDISAHEYALTYKEWKTIVTCYLKHIFKYLRKGLEFEMPEQLGSLQFVKIKRAKPKIDFVKTRELYGEENKNLPAGKKKVAFMAISRAFGGYSVILKWKRNRTRLKYKWMWRFAPSKKLLRGITKDIMNDTSLINKIHSL